ncbi:MAG: hypothetical protein KF709_13775 [Gemmatimonadaceae bacterium]|nr:hypothetical protein [Gemmatimonadaceae bacterium]
MRRFVVSASAALVLAAAPAAVQAQTCGGNPLAEDACYVASDLFRYMGGQLGTAIAGGSHTLGLGTNLGGFPRFSLALRVNAVKGNLPELGDVFAGPASARNFAVEDAPVPMATVDFALGLTKGFNVGVTRIGGVDLIGGLTYVPEITEDEFTLTPESNIAVGLGARVGLLEQSALLPGVSVSYMKRDLPTLDFGASADNGTSFDINDFSVKTTSWRISAQKNLLLFQLGAGFGGDSYDLSTSASVNAEGNTGTLQDALKINRTTMYGTLGVNLWLMKIVAEVGQVSGGTIGTFHTYDTPADDSRLYGSVGIRIGK